jgi:dihydroflavonol-4-reductase
MKVLVTGANGLLGVNLIRELVQSGVKAKAFVRPGANLKALVDAACEVHKGNILSFDDIHDALRDCDAVVHAASTTSVLPIEFEFFEKVNVDATKNVVQAVLRQGNKRLVYVSTAHTFGPGPKENPGTELSPFTLGHYNSGYINSKYMAQQHVLQQVEAHQLDAVVVNPNFILGPYDAKPSSGKIILFGLKRGPQWCPAGGKNFVHARDVARGIHGALKVGRKGQCYLLGGENLTYQVFFSQLNLLTGHQRSLIVLPKGIVHVAGAIADTWSKLTHQAFAFNKANAHLLTLDNYYSSEKARIELNLEITPVRDAIAEALEWFKKENYITKDYYSTQGTSFDL